MALAPLIIRWGEPRGLPLSRLVCRRRLGAGSVKAPHLPSPCRTPSSQAIKTQGALLICLPPYSPDLNSIEQVFARLKAVLRKIAAYTLKGDRGLSRRSDAIPSHVLWPLTPWRDDRHRFFSILDPAV
jgi:hypothetical protein